MRVRTAVSITAAIIIAQSAVTWFAAKAWLATGASKVMAEN